jgi:hypothetical protein
MPFQGTLRRHLTVAVEGGLTRELAGAMYTEYGIETTEVRRRTPVDDGHLRASVREEGPVMESSSVTVAIVAGDPLTREYAIPVHENLDALHPVGQAKFLESVVMESAPHIAGRIARRMNLRRAFTP